MRVANSISVVTPTLSRPEQVAELLDNLSRQTRLPKEVILVDGAPSEVKDTEQAVDSLRSALPFDCVYIRQSGGTAIQRNTGIEAASGAYIALVDDDVRLKTDFLERMLETFERDRDHRIGGVVGYRQNRHFSLGERQRWRWYQRLRLLTTFEPGHYDYNCGYPINANMQPPFSGTRSVGFMTTSCATWRREVFDSGLRFDLFFSDYGVLEDAHFSLRAARTWKLLQCGDAKCDELHAAGGRVSRRRLGFKCVVNYYYVFQDIVRPLTLRHKLRFWRFQGFELFRIFSSALMRRRFEDLLDVQGRIEGFWAVATGTAFKR
jgi:GT2 family glycosyltransferase